MPRRSPAWLWVAATALPAVYLLWIGSWLWAALLGLVAALIVLEPRLRGREYETVQIDDAGVLRVDGHLREKVRWNEIEEIQIITTAAGPWTEDVFFVLTAADGKGCLVPHTAAIRTKLLEELQARFPSLDDRIVIEAMGCTGSRSFVIWKKAGHAA